MDFEAVNEIRKISSAERGRRTHMEYNKSIFCGYLLKGNLKDAIKYLQQFSEMTDLLHKYISLFEKETYINFDADEHLNEILLIYQNYYREVFYLNVDADKAEELMKHRFLDLFNLDNKNIEFDDIEQNEIYKAFRNQSFEFLGGKTSGYYGPYIWKKTELKTYNVELPDSTKEYQIKFLDGFISKSWLDYISFGETGTGGWIGHDGMINCIRDSYDLEGEGFYVSLLKHEAQHAADLGQYQNMSSEDLEYRAKLVELIYTNKRNLLDIFLSEADRSNRNNGHSAASNRIAEEFTKTLDINRQELKTLSIEKIQSVSRELFIRSNEEMKVKYSS